MSSGRYVLSILALVCILPVSSCSGGGQATVNPPVAPPSDHATLTVDVNTVLVQPFTGFGVQWDPYSYPPSAADWQTTLNRLTYMRPSLFRVMSMATDYCLGFDQSGTPIYVWDQGDAVAQQYLWQTFRILDYAQANNTDVILGEWAWPSSLPTPGASPIAGPDDPRWARIVADFVTYLTTTRHYTVIKYFNYMNEPNGAWMWPSGQSPSFSQWSTGIQNLHSQFASHSLSAVSIIGPDNAWDWQWLDQAAQQLSTPIGAWDMHWYATDAETTGDSIEQLLNTKRALLLSTDPNAAAKPRFLAEAGMVDGKTSSDQNPRVKLFEYGVLMADLGAQVARAGWTGANAWDLDDAIHSSGNSLKMWGFWNTYNATGDPLDGIRPWFYTWSLMCRLMPKGSAIVSTGGDSGLSSFRSTAATWTSGATVNATVMLVNDANAARTITLRAPALGRRDLYQYNYFASDSQVDSNGYPAVKTTLTGADLGTGIMVDLPSRGVVFLTTANN